MSKADELPSRETTPPVSLSSNLASIAVAQDALTVSIDRWLAARLDGRKEDHPTYDQLLTEIELQMLVLLLRRFENRVTRLASALDMNRATLRRKLRDLGLKPEPN